MLVSVTSKQHMDTGGEERAMTARLAPGQTPRRPAGTQPGVKQ